MLSAANLLAELGDLQRETREVLAEAKKVNDQRLRLLAIREGRNNVEAFRDTHIKLDEHNEFEQRLDALEQLVNGGEDAR